MNVLDNEFLIVDDDVKLTELSFEKLCASLEELGIHKPYELTVFQFYSKIRYFKEKKPPAGIKK